MSVRVLGWVALVAAGAVLAVPWLPDEWQVWSIRGQEKAVLVRDVVGQEATATPPARSRELSGDGATAAGPPQEQNADPGPGPALALDNPRSSAAPESNGPAGAAPGATSESESPPRQSASPFPLEELREYMLDLINEDRQAHDLSPVALGYNPAAQAHAEEMLEHSYLSHWGMDGLKPYMRYTLAGGINYEAENVSGIAAPLQEGVRFREQSPFASMRESQAGFMNSPGHRANVLNEWHQKVNLGIACNLYTCTVVQQFQGDYLAFSWVPSLDSGRLTMKGILAEPFTASSVQVWYDQPPHPLALGQLDTTHSYRLGQQPAAFLRKPPPTGSYYPQSATEFTWRSGVDPYLVDPASPRRQATCVNDVCSSPQSPDRIATNNGTVPLITADVWESSGGFFRMEADIGPVIDTLGAGVYTVVVWGEAGGKAAPLTNYSIFVE